MDVEFDVPVSAPRPRDLHMLTWTHEGGWAHHQLECKHEPFPEGWQCGKDASDPFLEEFEGADGTPLHDGLIEFFWRGYSDEAELWWDYVKDEEQR